MRQQERFYRRSAYCIVKQGILVSIMLAAMPFTWATEELQSAVSFGEGFEATTESTTQAESSTSNNVNGNSGDLNIMQAKETGVAVNGDADGASINSNKNVLSTGNNTNMNLIAPTLLTPTTSSGGGGGLGVGGNAVLMLPRNPLPLPNAMLGRSNLGVQFGLQNNPILSSLGRFGGNQSALGWFLQAGLTIPFGKVPDTLVNPRNAQLDDARQKSLEASRNVLGDIVPKAPSGVDVKTDLNGKIVGMGAYNYSTIPSSKINLPDSLNTLTEGGVKLAPPKLLAISPADVFSKPLNTGERVGVIEVGSEYPYLGHTRSGWIKVLLPNGMEGWTSTRFEYIKHDFTEIDTLALDPNAGKKEKTAVNVISNQINPENKVKSVR